MKRDISTAHELTAEVKVRTKGALSITLTLRDARWRALTHVSARQQLTRTLRLEFGCG